MRRLELKPPAPDVIGGIPADSEYIIFIVDTSGSMQRFAWEAARRQMTALLDAYPKVRGMQVMNDMGSYMFQGYRGRWIPGHPRSGGKIVLRQFRALALVQQLEPGRGHRRRDPDVPHEVGQDQPVRARRRVHRRVPTRRWCGWWTA